MIKRLFYFIDSGNGVTSIEYAIIAGLIAMVIVIAVTDLGNGVNGLYQSVVNSFP